MLDLLASIWLSILTWLTYTKFTYFTSSSPVPDHGRYIQKAMNEVIWDFKDVFTFLGTDYRDFLNHQKNTLENPVNTVVRKQNVSEYNLYLSLLIYPYFIREVPCNKGTTRHPPPPPL